MRWLLFLLAVSASADCTSHLAYRTADYILKAVIDDGALYVTPLLARDVERIDLATGERAILYPGGPVFIAWDVQHGFLVTPATIGRPDQDVKQITIRDGSVYWLESDGVLRRMILGGGAAMTVAERVDRYEIFSDRVVFLSEAKLFWKRLTDAEPTLVADHVVYDQVLKDRIFYITDDSNLFWKRFTDSEPTFVISGVYSIGPITSDTILVTTGHQGRLYEADSEVLRVSWSGNVLETLHQIAFTTYHNSFDLWAFEIDDIVYVAQRQYGTSVWKTTLLAIQGGFAREIYSTAGDMWILDANEHGITFADWGLSTGFHDVVQLHCVSTPRARAVR